MFWKLALTPFYLLMIGFFAFHLWQLWKPTPPSAVVLTTEAEGTVTIRYTGNGGSSGGNGGVGKNATLEEMERMTRGGNGGAAPGSARINSSGPGGSGSTRDDPRFPGASGSNRDDPTRAGAGEKP
jgi:hypothetical protein